MSNTPSNTEAWDLWLESITGGHHPASLAKFARAVLAKWGTPQPVAREPAAWRLTNTAYRKPKYEYFEHKSHAEVRQEQFNQSVDDGGLHNLTPLYTAPQPAPAPLSDDVAQKTWALIDELEKLRGADRYDEDWDTLNKRDSELRAALAAQGGTP